MSSNLVNFSAGPAILDASVLRQASADVLGLEGLGLSILEISHRSPTFDAIINEARAGLKRLLSIPDTHEVLFLQGGARGQFAMIPLNFLKAGEQAAYVDTGRWAAGAKDEADVLGSAVTIASSKGTNYTNLPDLSGVSLAANTAYVHTCSNNTIFGTQWQELPDFGDVPHVCDMSSDILSRRLDISRFGLIYAGAQKNAGPAGVTLAIIRKDWMENARTDIPAIWQYGIHASKDSMYNTPPVFAIHCVGLAVKWLEGIGGLAAIEARNDKKATMLYGAIDNSDGFYKGTVTESAHRSKMNVTWRLPSEELEKQFVAKAAEAGLMGLKGHRSAGGVRASIYNALAPAGIERLVSFMADFKAENQ